MSEAGRGRDTDRNQGVAPRTHFSNDDIHDPPPGATPIDEDYREYLVEACKWVTSQSHLNQVEAANITNARIWLVRNQFESADDLLSQASLHNLHRQMFCDVWTWAGCIRARETSIGVDPSLIVERLENVLRDARTHIQLTSFPLEEIAVRFHWQLVRIHPYPNGNGRHARLVTNELARVIGLGESYFSWGARSGARPQDVRAEYLAALREADATGDLERLLRIANN
jgi:Fic-DOC domain mobile mystery protein B